MWQSLLVSMALSGPLHATEVQHPDAGPRPVFSYHFNPATELKAIRDDLCKLPADMRSRVIYLTLYNEDPAVWYRRHRSITYVLNAVSRSPNFHYPTLLCNGRILRVDLGELYPDENDFQDVQVIREELASVDPYWKIKTEAKVNVRSKKTGKIVKKIKTFHTDGGWVGLGLAIEVHELTGYSGNLFRADWFCFKAMAPPFYYKLANIPETRDEWYKQIGVDLDFARKQALERGSVIDKSGITLKRRAVARTQGQVGMSWDSYDFKAGTPEQDPFLNPDLATLVYAAGEHIRKGRNGLDQFSLYDFKGKRQDAVPQEIVSVDTSDPHKGPVIAGMSCVRCHVEGGLRPIKYTLAEELRKNGLNIFADKQELAERLRATYLKEQELQKATERDREDYEARMAELNGLSVFKNASELAEVDRRYRDYVTLEEAAREVGLTPAKFACVMSASRNGNVTRLAAGTPLERDQFEFVYHEIALLAATQWSH